LFFLLLSEPQGFRRAQFRFLHRDGSWRWIDAWATNLLEDDAVQAVVVNYRDITPWKAVEGERQKLMEDAQAERDRAEAANRAKDQFLAVLSHELRTPLTPVLAVVTDLEARGAVPEQLRSDIDLIRRNIEMEARLIDDLLDLTRISRGKLPLHMETVDAHELLRHAHQTCCGEDASGKKLDVKLSLDAVRHHVRGDAARLQQVFWNLIGNAVKFTPAGASVRISTWCEDRTLRIEIADTGIGIQPELLPRIFNAFEQGERAVTRRFGGLGLGLTISKQIIELHRGKISVSSEGPGQGSTFSVELSLASEPERSEPVRQAPASTPTHGRRILLVEDDPDTARVMAKLLRVRGFDVTTAGDVATALAAAQRHDFDVLVSDLGLPDRSGLELPPELRKTRAIPAIALSGFGMDEDLQKSAEAGFAEHLVKPIDFQLLIESIHRLLRHT
jgi:signal transduction histidine kinase/CheY-like chemotaxis protein